MTCNNANHSAEHGDVFSELKASSASDIKSAVVVVNGIARQAIAETQAELISLDGYINAVLKTRRDSNKA